MDENQYMYSPQGSINPRLTNQTAYETISDPLIRQLYFGSAGVPGFYNQLLSAGQEAAGQIQGGLGMYMPFLNQAQAYGERAFGEVSPQDIEQFYNPYEDRVVEQTIDDLVEQAGMEDVFATAQGIQAAGEGAFGSRGKLFAGERAEALGRGLGQALGDIRRRGFDQAFENMMQSRGAAERGAEFQSGLATLAPSLYFTDVGRNLGLLSSIYGMLPGYQGSSTQLTSQYGIPPDPKALGLGAGLGFFGNFNNPREYDPRNYPVDGQPAQQNVPEQQQPQTGFFGAPYTSTPDPFNTGYNPFTGSQSNPFDPGGYNPFTGGG
jgi:hypothetical protein